MSDTEGMVRIMEHAAESLRVHREYVQKRQYDRQIERYHLDGVIASMAYGRAVLQMVAASVAPEGANIAARLREDYAEWAEATPGGADLTDTELASVARFIRGDA